MIDMGYLLASKLEASRNTQWYADYAQQGLEKKSINGLSGNELLKAKLDNYVNNDVSVFISENNDVLSFQKTGIKTNNRIEDSEAYQILSNEEPRKDAFLAIKYATYDAIFEVSKKNTFMKSFLKMSQEEQQKIVDFINNNQIYLSSPGAEEELANIFLDEMGITEFKNKIYDLHIRSKKNAMANTSDASKMYVGGSGLAELMKISKEIEIETKELDREAQIERNNRMLMRKYNGAKSKNINAESKNEILKTFFEGFLKNNNPLAFLEIIKKTDIKA
ncbi:MAG: hypothetical protein MR582_01090 [Campylobacter sp.]|nr:hypothetical protein [Campylobacter sp.]